MNKTKAAIYLALIFVAGAIAGGAVIMSSPQTFAPDKPARPHKSPKEFEDFIWNHLKDRLELTEEQAKQIEPIFHAGFAEIRAIQERSLQEVEAAIRKNHEQMGALLTEQQRLELEEMNRERQEFFKKRGHKAPPGKPPGNQKPPGDN